VHRRLLLLAAVGGTVAVLGPAASVASAVPPTEPEPAPPGYATGAPEVEIVGRRLVCLHGTWAGARVRFTYAWLRDGAALPGATGRSYRPTAADRHGHVFTCVVRASNREGSEEEESWNAVELGGPVLRPDRS